MISIGLLKHRVTIQRGGTTADATGFLDPWASPTTVATGVACTIQPRKERLKIYREGRVTNGEDVAYFNWGADVQENDRLVVTAGPSRVGDVLDVRMADDSAGRGALITCGVDPFQPQRA